MEILNKENQVALSTLSKKDIKQQAINHYQEAVDSGFWYANEVYTLGIKMAEYGKSLVDAAKDDTIREHNEKVIVNGVELSSSNTGERLNYEEDEVYADLKAKLKERENLLKLAFKTKEVFYDSEGVEIPKVGIKTHGYTTIKTKY